MPEPCGLCLAEFRSILQDSHLLHLEFRETTENVESRKARMTWKGENLTCTYMNHMNWCKNESLKRKKHDDMMTWWWQRSKHVLSLLPNLAMPAFGIPESSTRSHVMWVMCTKCVFRWCLRISLPVKPHVYWPKCSRSLESSSHKCSKSAHRVDRWWNMKRPMWKQNT